MLFMRQAVLYSHVNAAAVWSACSYHAVAWSREVHISTILFTFMLCGVWLKKEPLHLEIHQSLLNKPILTKYSYVRVYPLVAVLLASVLCRVPHLHVYLSVCSFDETLHIVCCLVCSGWPVFRQTAPLYALFSFFSTMLCPHIFRIGY
jgi:hypothetical protein